MNSEDRNEDEAGNQDRNGIEPPVINNEVSDEPKLKRQKSDENGEKMIMESEEGDAEESANDGQIVIYTDNEQYVQMSVWVWEAVLKFITRMEMADRVSLVCQALKKLCWPRLHGKKVAPRMVEEDLYFRQKVDEVGQTKTYLLGKYLYAVCPLAALFPVPHYIQGFRKIFIDDLDSDVLQFIGEIRPLLANLHLCIGRHAKCTFDTLQKFLRALNGCPISTLDIYFATFSILELRQGFPGLTENMPAISVLLKNGEECDQLNELVLAKMGSGKPFFMNIVYLRGNRSLPIDKIRKAFQTATQPQSFCVFFSRGPSFEAFQMENDQTGELLALRPDSLYHNPSQKYELYRCPRGQAHQWRREAKTRFSIDVKSNVILLK